MKKSNIIITVRDGMVEEVLCNKKNVSVEIFDFDTQDDDELDELNKRYDEVINDKSYKDILLLQTK